jgi:acyl dehydratase
MPKSPENIPDQPRYGLGLMFGDMTPGTKIQTGARTIREADFSHFVALAGFTESIFQDDRHTSESGYEGRLIPGQMTYALAEGLVLQTNILNGTGLALLSAQIDIQAPVYVHDTIDVIIEFVERRLTADGERGVVTSRHTVRNQVRDGVLIYSTTRLIRSKPVPSAGDQLQVE